jgi:C1A family cysteine protease
LTMAGCEGVMGSMQQVPRQLEPAPPATRRPTRSHVRALRRWLLIAAAAVTSFAVLSGGAPVGAAGTGSAAPWDGMSFPSRLDLRDRGWVTPVRSQEQYGTCWIMAATGSLESSVVRLEGVARDFSENNLADHMSSRLHYQGYAPSELAAAYYARWEGPVYESADPYPAPGGSPDFLRAARHVQEVLFLPRRAPGALDNAAVKWAITTYGGVDAALDFDTNAKFGFWNPETHAYYNGTRADLDHHVLCVGWDDAYPAAAFTTPPPGDGAFLMKNSWSSDWGDGGYFWLSYYDVSFGDGLAVFDGVEPADTHDAVYQYDALGRGTWIGTGGDAGSTSAWFANRFSCAGTGDVTAVSFYTPVPGTSYEVRVAGALQDVGTAAAVASGALAVAGYHTVDLPQPVRVTEGGSFVVAVRVTTPGWYEPVPVEAPSEYIAPRSAAGQSFVSVDGASWIDLTLREGFSQANVCLKAFVDDPSGVGDTGRPLAQVRGGTFSPGTTLHVGWRLTDPGFSSASAIVVLAVHDASGRLMARRRIPAVAVGEHGAWSFFAGWPRGRYAVTGRAFDVAGHRQAEVGRAVLVLRGAAARTPAPVQGRRS